MDSLSVLIAELEMKQRQIEREASVHVEQRPRAPAGLRHSLATTFVRLGLRLDPAAGEDLGAPLHAFAHQERGC